MEIIYLENIEKIKEIKNLSLVLGYFDGLHIGHINLINFAINNSRGPVGVLTFDKPIKNVNGLITSIDDKIRILNDLKVDYLLVARVDEKFINTSYIDFVDKILKEINPIKIFCGPDYRFGKSAKGDVYYLNERFNNLFIVDFVNDNLKNKISSTKIRQLIKDGSINEVVRYLGREYSISGIVVHGDNLGNKLGFPTINLSLSFDYVLPKKGVYISKVLINGKKYDSITNIGTNPTITDSKDIKIETFIFDFNEEIYNNKISIFFLERLRDEKKFSSIDKLVEQLKIDKENAINYFRFGKF